MGSVEPDNLWHDVSRREFLRSGTAGAAVIALPFGLLDDVGLRPGRPPGFPDAVPLARRTYENWATSIHVEGIWTCRPRTAAEVVDVVNWAHEAGWTARALGSRHGWSPLTITAESDRRTKTILVDTRNLIGAEVVSTDPPAVRVGTGLKMLGLLEFLQQRGWGLTSYPATGAPTVGGALAIGAHGAALPADGEPPAPNHTFGSLSNLVLAFTAVVWDPDSGRYGLRTFTRSERDAKAFLVHVGRAFITDVTLRAGAGAMMRCQSFMDIPASEMFAAPGAPGRTFERFIAESGRAEAIWFAFTDKPWLKVWTPSAAKPAESRAVSGPYNYPFSDSIPRPLAKLASRLVRGHDAATPEFGAMEYEVARAGLSATDSEDLWGHAKDVQLYIRASTLRVDELGYGILTRRSDVQRVVHAFTSFYAGLVDDFRARGSYPMNGPLEIRASGTDDPADVQVPGARPPVLSPSAPRADRPQWDTVVWPNSLTFPGTRDSYAVYREVERWMLATFDGTWATLRPEWSKTWAMTPTASCADREMLDSVIPGLISQGRTPVDDFEWTHRRLDAHDPHGVLSNPFLDRWRGL